jgi:hypothetical protein
VTNDQLTGHWSIGHDQFSLVMTNWSPSRGDPKKGTTIMFFFFINTINAKKDKIDK